MHANRCSCQTRETPAPMFEIADPDLPSPLWMMRCPACGSLFPDAWPGAAGAYERYYTLASPPSGWRRVAQRLAEFTRRDYLDRRTPLGARRLLDYGCGDGRYLRRMAGQGRTCFGVEAMRVAGGVSAWTWLDAGEIAEAGSFDWITLGHVLEHLDDPAAVVGMLRGCLSSGGGMWIATPNARSFIMAIAGGWSRDVDYPRHREIFSRAGIEQLAAKAGLTLVWLSPPRLNAVFNMLSTLAILRGARSGSFKMAHLVVATLRHLFLDRARRDRDSPELVVLLRLRSPTTPATQATPPYPARSSGPGVRC